MDNWSPRQFVSQTSVFEAPQMSYAWNLEFRRNPVSKSRLEIIVQIHAAGFEF